MSDAGESRSDQLRDQLKKVELAAWWVSIAIIVVVLIYSGAMALQGYKTGGWRGVFDSLFVALATALAVTIAAFLVGALLGFLFGIPKSLQQPKEVPAPAPSGDAAVDSKPVRNPAFATNTSLEEISDWLTKIIVGLSLIEFERVLQAIYWCALAAASFAGQQAIAGGSVSDWTKFGSSVAVAFYYALIVSSLIAGLLFMYMETRTRVAILFNQTMDALDSHRGLLEQKFPGIGNFVAQLRRQDPPA